ncbi:hypothetical protein V5738_09925 [Salinisphaera sp. SPP-AMP-43]|uniref:hypothetical protein n=1 Tax=Salinisphaera sp. SPP-AMP-43 TaxID=3121288 RepID=UPI003C6E4166
MTDVFKLALLGHQYGASLLRETQVVLDAGDWGRARERVAEFAIQIERSLMAEAELMYSNRFCLGQRVEVLDKDIGDQQRAIWYRTRQLVENAEAKRFEVCRRLVNDLLGLLARYWQSEQSFYRALPCDDQLLWQFASRLRALGPDMRPN